MDEDEIDELLEQIEELSDAAVGREIILEILDEVGITERAG